MMLWLFVFSLNYIEISAFGLSSSFVMVIKKRTGLNLILCENELRTVSQRDGEGAWMALSHNYNETFKFNIPVVDFVNILCRF